MLLTPDRIRRLLTDVRRGRCSVAQATERLRALPYDDLGFAKLDTHRALRRRHPEAVLCEGKTPEQVAAIVERLEPVVDPLLLTRVSPALAAHLVPRFPALTHYAGARMMVRTRRRPAPRATRYALIVTAGTSDLPVAEEARVTLLAFGYAARQLVDVGVAGIHRLAAHVPQIQRAAVLIVVAGMDGALPSVVAGLAGAPVIAVPTSVGYGASFRGIGPLLTMLNTCAPGVVTVNIDNGFGAAYVASLLLGPRR